ncbi:Hpt domain-containing protein [Lichenihabitans sp. Uapishka_5]|uniref:Hpt domain-containing protein n=1 Tax=Lichenihabitans sp. Uapishka_5 TaxID=3037302 RepID=UPI0029E7F788|nr:Hpt domain-containing protein [Lichenihabitans sp. Uapishka_5]MDX7949690.1 Hpt domain-containing protein [Lichenihabitans sp. Uapishka_5]
MIDLEHLARQTAGDLSLQHELLTLFQTQLDELRDCVTAATQRPHVTLEATLHRVRGAAVAIGAFGLAEALGRAEAICDQEALSPLQSATLVAVIEATRTETTGLIAASAPQRLAKAGESR